MKNCDEWMGKCSCKVYVSFLQMADLTFIKYSMERHTLRLIVYLRCIKFLFALIYRHSLYCYLSV